MGARLQLTELRKGNEEGGDSTVTASAVAAVIVETTSKVQGLGTVGCAVTTVWFQHFSAAH